MSLKRGTYRCCSYKYTLNFPLSLFNCRNLGFFPTKPFWTTSVTVFIGLSPITTVFYDRRSIESYKAGLSLFTLTDTNIKQEKFKITFVGPGKYIKGSGGGQVRIQDLVKGGPQLLRPKVADVAKWSRTSKASILWLGSRAHLSGPWKLLGF